MIYGDALIGLVCCDSVPLPFDNELVAWRSALTIGPWVFRRFFSRTCAPAGSMRL